MLYVCSINSSGVSCWSGDYGACSSPVYPVCFTVAAHAKLIRSAHTHTETLQEAAAAAAAETFIQRADLTLTHLYLPSAAAQRSRTEGLSSGCTDELHVQTEQ